MSGGQNPLDKLKSVDWRGLVRTATNKVKQYAMNLSPLEVQVEEATNMDTWGPHGSVMSDIADACYDPEGYRQVLGVIARRLQERDEHWRMCYKALLLLEFLLKQGPPKIADDVLSSMSVLDRLQRFEYKDANGRDHGANVRHRAQEIAQLVQEPDRLRDEREKARANKAKYKGVSAAEMRMGGGFGNGSGGSGRRGFDPNSLVRPGDQRQTSSGFGANGGASGSSSSSRAFGSDSFGTGRSGGGGGYSGGGGGFESSPRGQQSGSAASADAVAATRARIEQLKLKERSSGASAASSKGGFVSGSGEGDGGLGKKKLTDVKVNPEIAASLGLKVAPPKATGGAMGAAAPPPTSVPGEVDLLGGLDDPEPEAVLPVISGAAADAAPAAGGWDAFGDSSAAAASSSAAEQFDAFGLQAPVPAAGKAVSPGAAKAPLPEDMFADLTGLGKPQQPMGTGSGLRTMPAPLSGSTSPSAAAPLGGNGGFADFSSVPAVAAPAASDATPAAPAAKDPFADLLS